MSKDYSGIDLDKHTEHLNRIGYRPIFGWGEWCRNCEYVEVSRRADTTLPKRFHTMYRCTREEGNTFPVDENGHCRYFVWKIAMEKKK